MPYVNIMLELYFLKLLLRKIKYYGMHYFNNKYKKII